LQQGSRPPAVCQPDARVTAATRPATLRAPRAQRSRSDERLDPQAMDNITELIDGPRQFIKDSAQLINRCTKPDRRGVHGPSSRPSVLLCACCAVPLLCSAMPVSS
jgi:hypothetical protein